VKLYYGTTSASPRPIAFLATVCPSEMSAVVLESTPTRLVVSFGYRLTGTTVCAFDKTTGRARFESRAFFWRQKPVDVPLSEITSIGVAVRQTPGPIGTRTRTPQVQLRSGKSITLPTTAKLDVIRSVMAQMRQFLGLPEPTADETQIIGGRAFGWLYRIAGWFIVVVAVLIGAVQLLDLFVLPECDSKRARDTLQKIFTDRKIELRQLTDIKSLSSTSSEKSCQARAETPEEQALIFYGITWSGWTQEVRISHSLPACDAPRVREAVRNIFTERKVELSEMTDIKTVSESSAAINCQALVSTPTETATIDYEITWTGKTTQVLIKRVTNQ
jgi:hypothetical protein